MPSAKKINQLKGLMGLLKNAEEEGSVLAHDYLRRTHGTNLPYDESLRKARMIANEPFDENLPKNIVEQYPKGSLEENQAARNMLMRSKQEPDNEWLKEETEDKWNLIRSLLGKNK